MSTSDVIKLYPKYSLAGDIEVGPDKSISHRAVMCGALAYGKTVIKNFLMGQDCLSTIDCFRKLGVNIKVDNSVVTVTGSDFNLKKPAEVLNVNNSGTTLRLITGILAGCDFCSTLDGDESIKKRPMARVTEPLTKMGAKFSFINENFCPLTVFGGKLNGIDYILPVNSAQVKSAIIFAALRAASKTIITEPKATRDHTERMLKAFGADLISYNGKKEIMPVKRLFARNITVPGDISSAAFFIAAGLITENSQIKIKNVGVNPTRSCVIDIFKRMGGNIIMENYKDDIEPVCDIIVKSSKLKGTKIEENEIAVVIDEIPIIAAVAAQSEGTTIIQNAAELKFKESNRIDTVFAELSRCGASLVKTGDGFIINGKSRISGCNFKSYGDHRIAMMCGILSLVADGESTIENYKCADVSFPQFFKILQSIGTFK